jgi:putative ABC transport system substrate-binding protein
VALGAWARGEQPATWTRDDACRRRPARGRGAAADETIGVKRASRLGLILWLAASVAAPAIGVEVVKPARVGYVWIGSRGTDTSTSDAGLHQGFTDKGYVIGRDLLLEERYADGHPERVAALVAELVALPVDVLMTPGTPITKTAQGATSTIPIVSVSGDPVGTGLVASLSRPGGNITGLSLLSGEYSVKWLELLRRRCRRRIASGCCGTLTTPESRGNSIACNKQRRGWMLCSPFFSARPADLDASLSRSLQRGSTASSSATTLSSRRSNPG